MKTVYQKSLLCAVVLLLAFTQWSAAQVTDQSLLSFSHMGSEEQKIIDKGMGLEQAFSLLEEVYDVLFLYSSDLLDQKSAPIMEGLHQGRELSDILQSLLRGSDLTYRQISRRTIGIFPEAEQASSENRMQENVSGRVIDAETGDGLPGVNITIQGTSTGTATDLHGEFELRVPDLNQTLVFSYIGYERVEVPLDGRTVLSIEMESAAILGDELVVVGFGVQERANLTGSVSTVSAETIAGRATSSADQLLQGVIPGLNLQTSGLGGELNNNLSINIRGGGTIGQGSNSSPLILIDGMEGNLRSLNPNDVESITVLKDAAAAAVYGSRAAFGVVIITTKQGAAGTPRVNYNNNLRFTAPLGLPTMMDSHTFALYYNEAAANAGQNAVFSDEVLERIVQYQNGEIDYGTVTTPDGSSWQYYGGSHANTDWFAEQYRPAAFAQDHNLSVSGGTEDITYYISGNFLDQEGLLRHAGDGLDRYALTARVSGRISPALQVGVTNRYIRENYTRSAHQNDLFYHNIARRWPTVPVYDPNGFYSDPSEINQLRDGGRENQLAETNYLQGWAVITPVENWSINAELNFRITNRNHDNHVLQAFHYNPAGEPLPLAVGWGTPGHTSVYEYHRRDDFSNVNVYSNYKFELGDGHSFGVMGGFNTELNKYRTLAASRDGLITPNLPTINTATQNSQAREGQYQHWATAGIFGRFNYNYKQRYLLEVNARYDGSSRFLDDQRWNLFPSVSVGWDLARESFFDVAAINQLKFRMSYGELGNQNTANWYPFHPGVPVSVNAGGWLVNGQRPTVASAPPLVSSLLTWERVESWNAGVDLGMLEDRLMLSLDVYERKTLDMVGPAPELPAILGTGVPRLNNADMKSTGFELEAIWRDNIDQFNYSIRAVLSDDQQTVTNYPNPTGNIGAWYNGRKSGEIWGYETIGIARTQAEMDAHLANVDQSALGSNWQAGDIMYKDVNGDGVIDGGSGVLGDTGDRSIIGNSSPRYRFSFDINGSYRNFDFRIFLQGVGKRDYMPNGPYFWGAAGEGMWQAAGFEEHMDFFRDENSVMVQAGIADVNLDAYFPRPAFGTGKNRHTQTYFLQDASYLRLKNLQLGYTLPASLTSQAGISNFRVFLSGENLLTFTGLTSIFDPETVALAGWNDGKTYPLAKVYSLGVEIRF